MLATLTDLEHRFSADVVRQWADDDRDGAADTAVVNAALQSASADVEAVLLPAYPTAIPFTAGNIPAVVVNIVRDYAGYYLAGRRQKAAEHYENVFIQAQTRLNTLIVPNVCLAFPDGSVVYSEGSSEAESNGFAWSSTADTDQTFTDTKLSTFVSNF